MASWALLIRWSWRDLRRRWLLVTAIALVIALGTGMFAALQSMTAWRRASNDASFAQLAMHDLEVALGAGQLIDEGALIGALAGLPDPSVVAEAEERLLLPTPIEVVTGDDPILVSGELVGMAADPAVARVHVFEGAGLDRGPVLDVSFARYHDLPATGTVRVRGEELAYVGTGVGPEYVYITGGERGGLFAHARYAVLFTPREVAQRLGGHPGQVNDLVLTLVSGSDLETVRADVERTLAGALPVTVEVTTRFDDPVYSVLYEDIDNDQQLMSIMALLILAGAAFAAFNLTSRIVEAERREIGIGMALGAPPARIAIRPLLVGVQVAALGALAGIGLGYLAAGALAGVLSDFIPLPTWVTELTPDAFLQAGLLGLLLPVVATAIPVWRAVRVEPVEAIRTGYLVTRKVGFTHLGRWLRVPGKKSYAEMPLRNVLRAPRRTLLTALGIGAAITTLVAILGLLNTFLVTVDDNTQHLTRTAPDRLVVALDTFQPADAVAAVVGAVPAVGAAEPGLQLGGRLQHGSADLDVQIDVLDFASAMWAPELLAGTPPGESGIVLARKALDDLGVDVGDVVTLTHPRLESSGELVTVATVLPVTGVHPGAFRFQAYLDDAAAGIFGLAGLSNVITVRPAEGVGAVDVERALFDQPGIARVQPVGELGEVLADFVEEFVGIFEVLQVFVLLLALLIAFNSSSITVDERAREHATMFAFGLRLRTVLLMITAESVVTGLLGTVVGLAAGYAVVSWVVAALLPSTFPEAGMVTSLGAGTVVSAAVLGIGAVAVAPLLTVRKLRRMDIPSTLRVME
jgi:putative ABC transport system permease protein